MVYDIDMKNIIRSIATVFLLVPTIARAAPPSFQSGAPLAGDVTWSPGVGTNPVVIEKLEEAWVEWEQISKGKLRVSMISSGSPRLVFHCSDKFPIGKLDGTDITVGDDVNFELRHVNLSESICSDPSRIIMLHAVGHALGWDNDPVGDNRVMSSDTSWMSGPAGDRGFTEHDVLEFSSWYLKSSAH